VSNTIQEARLTLHEAGVEAALLPCPFCGGEASLIRSYDSRRVACRNKDCFGPETSFFGLEADARAAWNRRASLPAPQGPAAQVSGAGVKALEWKGSNWADTPFGEYTIDRDEDDDVAATPYCCWSPAEDGTNLGHFATDKEAKAAAQADYEQRIRSALVLAPAPQPTQVSEPDIKAGDWREWTAFARIDLMDDTVIDVRDARGDYYPHQPYFNFKENTGIVAWRLSQSAPRQPPSPDEIDRILAMSDEQIMAEAGPDGIRDALVLKERVLRRLKDTGARAKLVEHMVSRFLSWKLPEHFHPDAGISFAPEYNAEFNAKRGLPPARHMPTGTNLFDATQARAMVTYMLDGFSGEPTYSQADYDEVYEIGKRDGYENAVQEIDLATGGDGEFKGSTFPGETVDVPAMKARIIQRCYSPDTGAQGAEPVQPVAHGIEAPLTRLALKSTLPEWQQVIDLFAKHGLSAPPWRLRDELVGWLTWARYGEAVEAALAQPQASREARNGIYIASKTKHAERWRNLRASGVPVIATWIDEAGEGESQDLHDLWRRCLSEASNAAAIIVYREPDDVLKGGWIELGAAASHGVPVFAVGIEQFTIARHRGIQHFATFDEALAAAIRALQRKQTP
jgi:hypothetical protein